jgi:Translocase of the Inner Mitochondrial membrane 29
MLNVFDDYKNVGKDSFEDAKSRPWRSSCVIAALSVAYLAYRQNPTRLSFIDALLESNNDLIQVPATARNTQSESFVVEAVRYHSADRLRYVNLGLFSLILHEDFNKSCDVYEAHCTYLSPSLFLFYQRVVDIGLFNHWLKIEGAMKDFDVNL